MPEPHTAYDQKEQLLQIAGGDETVFRNFVNKYAGLLFTFIYRHTDSREMAEDIVQDIFLQIWLKREKLAEVKNFKTYLFVVSRNHAINVLKKTLRNEQLLQQWQADLKQDQETPEYLDAQEEQLELLEAAIKKLPARQQQVWLLSRREGKSYQEIATELELSRETVKSHLQAANAALLKYVTENKHFLSLFLFF